MAKIMVAGSGGSPVERLFGEQLPGGLVFGVVAGQLDAEVQPALGAGNRLVYLFAGLGGVESGLARVLPALLPPQVAHDDAQILLALLEFEGQLPDLPLQQLVGLVLLADLQQQVTDHLLVLLAQLALRPLDLLDSPFNCTHGLSHSTAVPIAGRHRVQGVSLGQLGVVVGRRDGFAFQRGRLLDA